MTVQEGGSVTILPSLIDDPVVAKSGFNTNQTLNITPGGTATYQFSAPAGTRILVDGLDTVSENLYVILNAPDGTRLFTGFGAASEIQDIPRYGPAFLLQSGTYTLTLGGITPTDSGSYPFRVLDLDTFGTPLSLDTVVNGNFPTGREALVYTFDATVGDKLLFDGRSGAFIFCIYNDSLNGVYARGIFGAASTAEVDGLGRILRPGRHYVLFHGDPSIPQNFSFQILSLSPSLALGAEASGSVDSNSQVAYRMSLTAGQRLRIDDVASAPLLTFDSDLEVTLNPGNAARVFRIDATAGETLSLDYLGTFLPVHWGITGPITQSLGSDNDAADFSAKVLSSGTHYLMISGRQDSGPITIRFRATRTSGPVVPLTGFNTVVNLNVGINETKTYSISAPTGRLVYLDVLRSQFAIPTHTVTLNQGETYLLRDLASEGITGASDLTGSIITSTKPVADFGGNRATFIPSQFFATDHLVEQLPPTNTWGREFVTMPLVTGSNRGDLFRFLAQADNTQLTVNGTLVATLNRGQFYEQNLLGPGHIVSNNPILVAQYAYSQNYYRTDPGANPSFQGDPLMMIVPPFEQFLANYTVSTPAVSSILNAQRFDRNFINIVAPAEAVGLIEVNGAAVAANMFVAIGTSGFFGAQVPIALGSYQLAGPLPFGAFVYGFGSFDSYGYVGGQALSPVATVSSVVLTPATANPQIGNSLNLTARVADVSGTPIQGIRVDFDVAGVNSQRRFGFSDADGLVQFNYVGASDGRDIVTASVGQLLDDSIIDWRTGAAAPQIIVAAPLNGNSVAAGTTLVATELAIADFPLATLDLVTVNGVPLTSVDAAGKFFVQLFVGPGENEFEFIAIDSNGSTGSQVIKISGTERDTSKIAFTQFADDSGSFHQTYARSSFNQSKRSLLAETAIENVGQFPTDVPLLVGITNISDPMILVRDSDGQTPDGIPYYDFTGLVTGSSLTPRSRTGFLAAEFYNPNQKQFTYYLVFYGKLNEPPLIQSLPPTEADLNREYRYDVIAIDPNNDAITFELAEAPAGMTIKSANGQIRWTPSYTDIGLHTVDVRVSDTRLGVSTQRFTLSAQPVSANRVPVFTSFPLAVADVGEAYPYLPQAVDADGDVFGYRLVTAPSGMTINASSGLINWDVTKAAYEQEPVTIGVFVGRGGTAKQQFVIAVAGGQSQALNAHPIFVSTPPVDASVGTTLLYHVQARDPDGDSLTFDLPLGPHGMVIDATTGLLGWLPQLNQELNQAGMQQVVIRVNDGQGGLWLQSFQIDVDASNTAPVITSLPMTNASVGIPWDYRLHVQDADGDPLMLELVAPASGMTLSSLRNSDNSDAIAVLSFTPTIAGSVDVVLVAKDSRGGQTEQRFAVQVTATAANVAPIIHSVPRLKIPAGQTEHFAERFA